MREPQEDRPEVHPPSVAHVEAVYRILPTAYRLPLLVADATGMRVGEIEALTWGDVDEPERRFRVSKAKTRTGRFVPVPEDLFTAVVDRVPREDRRLHERVFSGFGADAFRTALTRACKATGIPAFSPHDLRHRRGLSLASGRRSGRAGIRLAGHSPAEHLRTYAHVVIDRTEIDYSQTTATTSAREHALSR